MKQLLLIILVLSFSLLFSDTLPVVVDMNRFLDDASSTIFDFNYQLTYNSLQFIKGDSGFTAGLKVEYAISLGDDVVSSGDFTSKLIFPNQEMTRSGKLFRDKLSVTLPNSNYLMEITFTDINSSNSSTWSQQLMILGRDTFLSDLEFSSNIVADSTDFLDKFHRNGQLYFVNCDHIYTKGTIDSLYLYYELGNKQFPVGKLSEKITILKDNDTLKVITRDLSCHGTKQPQQRKIDISDLTAGYHNITLEIHDPISNVVNVQEDYFSIKHTKNSNYRLFVDIEDEITLLKYFLPSGKTKIWKDLSMEGKQQFIDKFWEINDEDSTTQKNEFFELIKERIHYCNEHFSHFADGWNTDRGRIYIKHGKPDDIVTGDTGILTKYPQKRFEIWKYRVHNNFTYLFLDFSAANNHKMIYTENDPQETSSPHLEAYLGEDFDMGQLD
ncbi:MAG: GWxTD domain-containing protein [Candidatus Cloacimonetes bacterium]|nr:GWxTD domain-containing protein [Candidatus Cloacimonadota bacterium]